MEKTEDLFDRDLSWLSFNERVLMEAEDSRVPLYERIKFLGIYSSNLDEFFRVRVANIRNVIRIDKKKINKKFDQAPRDILDQIHYVVHQQQERFGKIKREAIIPELKKAGIYLYRDERMMNAHRSYAAKLFSSKILPYLRPILPGNSDGLEFANKQLYLVVKFKDPEHFGVVNIPSDRLSRFIELPADEQFMYFIAVEDVIREFTSIIFPDQEVINSYAVKLNRDADLNLDDEFSGDLVKKIQKQVAKRDLNIPSRLLYDQRMPASLLQRLIVKLNLEEDDPVPGGRYHNMNDLMRLPNPFKPKYQDRELLPLVHKEIDKYATIYEAISAGDQLLHFPYHAVDYAIRFFSEAAFDPDVRAISVTFYRVAEDSLISEALIAASNNGKDVSVFFEIKARFDEENNLKWADKMKRAGIHIHYSMPGLKVHAKVALVQRKDGTDYGYFGTGNFNEKTSRLYADDVLLTRNPDMIGELADVFNFLQTGDESADFDELLVSQFNIIERFSRLIEKQYTQPLDGQAGRIILKLNNIEDREMIRNLNEAASHGVRIDLIVRAICCIRPQEYSNGGYIRIHRIVDRFLEHSRMHYFCHAGNDVLFLGSADWMERNLRRRVEVVFPVHAPHLKKELLSILDLQLNDHTKRAVLGSSLENIRVDEGKGRAQEDTYYFIRDLGS